MVNALECYLFLLNILEKPKENKFE